MNVVLCEYAEKRKFTAGNKARTDTVRILKECGFEHIPLYRSKDNKAKIIAQIFSGCNKAVKVADRGDVIFLQYPYYPSIVNEVILSRLKSHQTANGYRLALMIHDVVSLRSEGDFTEKLQKEIEFLNKFDAIIVHNEEMAKILVANGLAVPYQILGPFDYIYNGNPASTTFSPNNLQVVIAGNLAKEKCAYAYALDQVGSVKFNLYGVDYTGSQNERVRYFGAFDPEELISHLEGSFGLVWDGGSIETCEGMYGNYLRYNNPHKFSLYIAAGMPVIVWKESALAPYVEKFGLGICVSSLKDLESLEITSSDYETMLNAVMEYRKELVNGMHLGRAVEMISR